MVNGAASANKTLAYSPGTYTFWANYSGDANNQALQTTGLVQEVITGTAAVNYYDQTGTLSQQGTITINLQ